jgi:HSP20 family protein
LMLPTVFVLLHAYADKPVGEEGHAIALVKWRPGTETLAWSPLPVFDHLRQEIDRLFQPFSPATERGMSSDTGLWTPHVDFVEKDEEYVLQADLPGMRREDIDVQLHEGTLLLKGERKMGYETQNGYYQRERAYGAFYRRFALSTPVEADQISATYRNGVLEVHIPKTAAAKPKRIAVHTASANI